ncbi:hypothetical protein ACTA71_002167 [Dictyostelium dimigraforme]
MQKFDAFLVYSYLPFLPIVYEPFIYLYDKKTTFGRRKTSDVEFFSMTTSRDHSSITMAIKENVEKEYFLEDSDTLNGTYINGVRIDGKTKLKHNDRIRFGSSSSDIRYTFKLNSKLSFDNINIFKFLKSLDKEKLKSHPLSKLFTPLLISSNDNGYDQDLALPNENNNLNSSNNNLNNNINNNNINNNNINNNLINNNDNNINNNSNNNLDNINNNLDNINNINLNSNSKNNNSSYNNNNNNNNNLNNGISKKLGNERTKKLQDNETPSNKTNISTKENIPKIPKSTNKKRKHEDIDEKEQEEDDEKDEEDEESYIEDKDKEEEKNGIFKSGSWVQYLLEDKSCEVARVISKNKNSYLVKSQSNKRFQIDGSNLEKAWTKRLNFKNVKTKFRIRILCNDKWYRGIVLEKRNVSKGRLKYQYLVQFTDIKQPNMWVCGSKTRGL